MISLCSVLSTKPETQCVFCKRCMSVSGCVHEAPRLADGRCEGMNCTLATVTPCAPPPMRRALSSHVLTKFLLRRGGCDRDE